MRPESGKPPRRRYLEYVLGAIDGYKDALTREELLAIGDEAVSVLESRGESYLASEVLLLEQVDRIIMRRFRLPSYAAWRRRHGVDVVATPLLLDSEGRELVPARTKAHLAKVTSISENIMRALQRDPRAMYGLSPRSFEELVFELLSRQGFACELTPVSKDGGKDVIARLQTLGGTFTIYVECKRFGPDRPVGISLVRELLGVVSHNRVTSGLLVTTSTFTQPALELAQCEAHRLTLRDYRDLTDWLRRLRVLGHNPT